MRLFFPIHKKKEQMSFRNACRRGRRSDLGGRFDEDVDSYVTSDPVVRSVYGRGSEGVEKLISEIWQTADRLRQVELIQRIPRVHQHHAVANLGWDVDRHTTYTRPSATRYTKIITSTIQDDSGHFLQTRKQYRGADWDAPNEDTL